MATSFKYPDVVDIPGAIGAWWRDLRLAAGFLTCLPLGPRPTATVPVTTAGEDAAAPAEAPWLARLVRATGMFPLVGAGIGIVGALALMGAFEVGLHPLACALVALAVTAAVTGALHEDGLADFADAMGAGKSRETRLRIMRDSRIGTFGTLAIVFGIGIRASILAGMSSPDSAAIAVIVAGAVSRGVLPAVMRWQQPARADGLAAAAGAPGRAQVITAALLSLVVALFLVGLWASLAIGLAVTLATLAVAALAERTLGGQTGDVLGTVQVIAEIAALAAIAAVE